MEISWCSSSYEKAEKELYYVKVIVLYLPFVMESPNRPSLFSHFGAKLSTGHWDPSSFPFF